MTLVKLWHHLVEKRCGCRENKELRVRITFIHHILYNNTHTHKDVTGQKYTLNTFT